MRRVDSRRILNRPRLCHLSLFGVNEVLFFELADTLSNYGSAYLCVIVISFSSFCQNRHVSTTVIPHSPIVWLYVHSIQAVVGR